MAEQKAIKISSRSQPNFCAMLRLLRRCVSTVRLDNINVSCKSEKNSATNLFGASSIRLFSSLVFAMTTTISALIFVSYTSYRIYRGEFEYVQSFTSHRKFRSVDTLDESL